jgi:alpha-L-rhamnosidase
MNSFNHYAYGSVAAWMYRVAAGIKPTEEFPAYERFEISPIPDKRLGYVRASIDTRHGKITSEWKYEDGGIRYCFEIPEGTVARVRIDGTVREMGAGKYTVWGDER